MHEVETRCNFTSDAMRVTPCVGFQRSSVFLQILNFTLLCFRANAAFITNWIPHEEPERERALGEKEVAIYLTVQVAIYAHPYLATTDK